MKDEYYIIIGVLLALIIVMYMIFIIKRNKHIDSVILKNNKCKALKIKSKGYDYVLLKDNTEIYIKIAYISKNSQVCINSKDTWKLSWNTFKTEKGKGYSNSRYMDELVNFLRKDIIIKDGSKNVLKYILLYKSCEGIVRYLNESELDVVTIKDKPYGYRVGTFENFESDLEFILNNLE